MAEESDLFALDDLIQDLDSEPAKEASDDFVPVDEGIEALLAAGEAELEQEDTKDLDLILHCMDTICKLVSEEVYRFLKQSMDCGK